MVIDLRITFIRSVLMKAQTMIFLGLFLLPSGILTGSILLFTSGSLSLLAGNLRLLSTMKATD